MGSHRGPQPVRRLTQQPGRSLAVESAAVGGSVTASLAELTATRDRQARAQSVGDNRPARWRHPPGAMGRWVAGYWAAVGGWWVFPRVGWGSVVRMLG